MVWWVLFQKAFSDLSSKADLLNTTEGSHGVFISLILPLKWSTICDDEKCPVLSDQPSLTTKMFSCVFSLRSDWSPWSVVVLPPALLSRKCFCGPGMLWVLSAGLTPHTAHPPLGSVCTGADGLGSTAWTAKPRRSWGRLHGSPHCTWGSQASLAALCPSDGETSQNDGVAMQQL